ncbi:hypothetical protein DPX16_10278 [Anabarilius grahami]|uniref:Uncharacterized protein n=1 Tax=Anabarilius grahami TaxID=495550 RepID=A0A3N0YD21_ANAGA|nr:hypothetical protein DPX16_10278 [Anabarilius grahami]
MFFTVAESPGTVQTTDQSLKLCLCWSSYSGDATHQPWLQRQASAFTDHGLDCFPEVRTLGFDVCMIEWEEDDEYLEETREKNKIRALGRCEASEEIRKDCSPCLVIVELLTDNAFAETTFNSSTPGHGPPSMPCFSKHHNRSHIKT